MLDTIETLSDIADCNTLAGEDRPTAARAMVPMLDWPTDLFNKFTAEIDDELE